MKILKAALIVLMAASIHCGYVIYEDCGSSYELESVNIEGCERTVPCYLTLGDQNNITVVYTAGFVSTKLTQEAYLSINSVQRQTNVTPVACEATSCPVKTLVTSQYEAKFEVPTNLALNSRGSLNWLISNENAGIVICFKVTIQTRSLGFEVDY